MSARVRWDLALEVARWEFRRFVKPKQLLLSLVLTLATAAGGIGVVRLFDDDGERVPLAAIGASALGITADTLGERFSLRHAAPDELPALRDSLASEAIAGVLLVEEDAGLTLLAPDRPEWQRDLEMALAAARQRARLAEAGIAPEQLAYVFEPVELELVYPGEDGEPGGPGEAMLVFGVLFLTFMGLMSGIGYTFAGITGEKQQRITEQVVSAVPPQSWMDGKILGLAGVSLANAATMALALGALLLVGRRFSESLRQVELTIGDPLVAVLVVAFPLLGFLLWFAFLCAVSAVMDDPHHSSKGSLLMVPLLPLVVAWLVFVRPTAALSQFFAIFPLTSWVVIPVRLLTVHVPWWEVPLAAVLLAVTIWLVRRAAGKIFAVGMLMYGKEPTVREIVRWVEEEG